MPSPRPKRCLPKKSVNQSSETYIAANYGISLVDNINTQIHSCATNRF